MISFTNKDLEALALLRPGTANSNHIDYQAYIEKAHRDRSAYVSGLVAGAYRKVANAYTASRQNARAVSRLQAMSNRELADLGITRGEIKRSVLGYDVVKTSFASKIAAFVAPLAAKYKNWQQLRSGYAQLMAMDSRQLSDLGLTRGEIAAAVAGKTGILANDNILGAANSNDGRQVS